METKKRSIAIGRPSVLRHTNALGILALLREHGTCSRADLVRATGLSAPTVTNVVKDLLDEHLIEELGEGESRGGRPPDLIRFKAERGCMAGVEITSVHIAFLLTDLNGNQLTSMKFPLTSKKTKPEAICGYIEKGLKGLLRRQKKTAEQLLLVVVSVPAIVNVNEGTVLSISTLDGWRSVPLRAMLNKSFDCLIIIENDTNLAAQGEHFCGAAQSERDFVYITIGSNSNVGAGVYLGGHIHHGSQWSAGEIAYLRLPRILRKQPTIHEFGELEIVLTSPGILKSWQELNTRSARSTKDTDLTAIDVLDLAMSGNAAAQKVVRMRADIVSDIIVNLSLILNPSLVLLGGEIGSHPVLLNAVLKQLSGSEFAVTRIGIGSLGSRAALWGAISLALETISSVLLPQPLV